MTILSEKEQPAVTATFLLMWHFEVTVAGKEMLI